MLGTGGGRMPRAAGPGSLRAARATKARHTCGSSELSDLLQVPELC